MIIRESKKLNLKMPLRFLCDETWWNKKSILGLEILLNNERSAIRENAIPNSSKKGKK